MEIEPIRYDFPNLFFKMVTLNMQRNYPYRDIHIHQAIEIIHVLEGSVECNVQDKSIPLNKDDILMIHPFVIHRIRTNQPSRIVYIQIDISQFSLQNHYQISSCFHEFIVQQYTEIYCKVTDGHPLFPIIHKLEQEAVEQEKDYQLYIKGYLYEISAYIHRHYVTSKSIAAENVTDITAIVTYIENNFHGKIHLEDIAQSVGIEKYSLCKMFKKVSGKTIVDYINFVRLQKARHMLQTHTYNISQTAWLCGFSSVQYFNRVFKKYHACTPREYMKSN